jgi:hypothetical protein
MVLFSCCNQPRNPTVRSTRPSTAIAQPHLVMLVNSESIRDVTQYLELPPILPQITVFSLLRHHAPGKRPKARFQRLASYQQMASSPRRAPSGDDPDWRAAETDSFRIIAGWMIVFFCATELRTNHAMQEATMTGALKRECGQQQGACGRIEFFSSAPRTMLC